MANASSRKPSVGCGHYTLAPVTPRLTRLFPVLNEVVEGCGIEAARMPCANVWRDSWHLDVTTRLALLPAEHTQNSFQRHVQVAIAVNDLVNVSLLSQIGGALILSGALLASGMIPAVYIGALRFSPASCGGEEVNPYYDQAAGENVWDYYFHQPVGLPCNVCLPTPLTLVHIR